MTENQFRWAVGAAIVFAAFIAYANTFANDFVWDDASSILLHQDVQHPSHILQLFTHDQHAYGRGQGNFYRPFVSLSFMIDTWLSRPAGAGPVILSPFLYHVSNILWHAAVAIALFALMTIFGAPRPVRVMAPLLYVVHPLHTEAIAYISGRADPMAAAFLLAALCCALAVPGNRGLIWCAVCFIAALLSKESATIFPFVLLLAALVIRRTPSAKEESSRANQDLIKPLAIAGAIVGIYAALRFTILRFAPRSESSASPLLVRLEEAGEAFALYLKLIFVPSGLHMERTLDGVPAWTAAAGWACIVLFVVLTIVAYRADRPRIALALGFFLITWLPISGIFPLNAPMAEHWMYLPMLGFLWALLEIVWMLVGATPLRYPVYALCYAACVLFVLNTVQRNHEWRNNESLYVATLRENPDSIRVNFNLGVTYEDLIGNASGARREFERVLSLYRERKQASGKAGATETFFDDELEAHLSLGRLYAKEQLPGQAATHFETLRRVNVSNSNADIIGSGYVEYAKLLIVMGRTDDAKKLMDEGVQRVPALQQQKEAINRLRQPAAGQQPGVSPSATPSAPG